MVSFNQDHYEEVKDNRKGKLRVIGGRKTVRPFSAMKKDRQVAEVSLIFELIYKLRQIA